MANTEIDSEQARGGVGLDWSGEQVSQSEGYSDWAEQIAAQASEASAKAEALAAEAHFANLIARSVEGDSSVKFGYVFIKDGKPESVMGSHTLTEMGEPGQLTFHYPETPHSLNYFGVGWEHNHGRAGNIVTLDLKEVDSVSVHPDGHALFSTEQNDGSFVYVITDQPFAARTAVEVAGSLEERAT